ncbi:MAG: D-alanyl-D-alanine carboxypeptidase, partial [Methylomonas sp.]|nr:D-alanyl-D-alanine carboxypeptidase [Methylomonas sp.]
MMLSLRFIPGLFFGLLLMLGGQAVFAAGPVFTPAPPSVAATSYFLMDFNSSRVLAEKDADKRVSPASLTKIMTVYVVFRELKAGHLTLTDNVTISQNAWQTGGS